MSASHIRTASVLTTWRKSTYSGGDNGDCIEVADHIPGVVPVRDSTAPHGPARPRTGYPRCVVGRLHS
jgi:hypothetical protein